MTKKHFEMIAAAIKEQRDILHPDMLAINTGLALRIANRLVNENPRFDRARFLAACGVAE